MILYSEWMVVVFVSGTYFVFGIVVNVIVFMAILSVLSVPDLSRRNGTRKIKTQVL